MFSANFSRTLFLLSLTLFLSSSATADPVSVVGTATPSPGCPSCGGYNFSLTNLSGSISMSIHTLIGVTPIGGIVRPGQRFFLDFAASGLDAIGSLTVDSVTYPAIAGLHLTANPLFAPVSPPGAVGDEFQINSFVFFTGYVIACDRPIFEQCVPLFTLDLIGSGRVDATVRILADNGPVYYVTHATYTLTTPEPSSLVLLVSGLLGFGGYVRRRNQRRKNSLDLRSRH